MEFIVSEAAEDSCSSSNHWRSYDAFLSFRGQDTRKGFTDHLYRTLEQAGIHTFVDDEIERGANIAAELQKAIQESRVFIIVFSKDYASSTWCLNELVQIMERRKIDHGNMVTPIFYNVEPSDVRNQTGTFSQAFGGHEERFKEEMDKVEDWRRALRDVADLGGMILGDGYESQFIEDIVTEIGKKLDPKVLSVHPYPVGIDYLVQGLSTWLQDGSNDVGIAVIYGMGGIGKTTVAKEVYNTNFDRFEASSFLADIRATSEKPDGLVLLQRELLFILNGIKKEIYSMDEGVLEIKRAICCRRVLIVLDDVNTSDQFNAIVGSREWFHSGSKLIVTTRHGQLFKAHEVRPVLFKVEELNEYESLELFSWHAFGQANPIEGYKELSTPLVQRCGGLPLALQVVGSSLSEKGVDVWKSALQKLNVITAGKIQKNLRISFDSLHDAHDKNLFLHIACFFIGKKKDYAITILDNCDFYTRIGIQNLVDRCLLEISRENRLVMHQLLRDMARGIICEESREDAAKRSRVWQKDASNVLRRLSGTETIKGLMLDLPMLIEDESSMTQCRRSNKKRSLVEDIDGNCSKRLCRGLFSLQSISPSKNAAPVLSLEDFKAAAFRRMLNLELLLLSGVKITGGYEDFPKNLIWLYWQGFHLKSIPACIYLENVVALELHNSRLQHVWKGKKLLPRLKILNLGHSHGLMTTPDFSGVPNLERLILKGCVKLVEVGESIGDLEKLVSLNLKDCKNLTKLPSRMGMLRSLQELILSGCSKLMLSDNITVKNQLYSTASESNRLNLLSAKFWQSIWSLVLRRNNPEVTSFSWRNLPHSLRSLSLAYCNLSKIPHDLGILSSLKYLDLSGNPITSLPENFSSFIALQTLLLEHCTDLKTLPELPPNLKSLQAGNCTLD